MIDNIGDLRVRPAGVPAWLRELKGHVTARIIITRALAARGVAPRVCLRVIFGGAR
jgi:hypothetical protein